MDEHWLTPARAQFLRLGFQLPHALLVQGAEGMGKHELAKEMVASLLCENVIEDAGSRRACGSCDNCVMFKSGNHPDFHYVSSEWQAAERSGEESGYLGYAERYFEAIEKRGKRKPRKQIAVDQIRALSANFSLSNSRARLKVALIEPAEAMNINAANALLKLLEEPSPDSILLLVSHDVSRLPMTIRSRCINLTVTVPTFTQGKSWLVSQGLNESTAHKALAISGGAPLIALAHGRSEGTANFENVISVLYAIRNSGTGIIESRDKLLELESPVLLLSWLQLIVSWLIESIQEQSSHGEPPWQAYSRSFSKLSGKLDQTSLSALFLLYDKLVEIRKLDVDVVNPAMILDKWLIMFVQCLRH